jgi:hypothetical protein
MPPSRHPFLVLVAALLTAARGLAAEDPHELFERRIRPVLVDQCHSCHGAAAAKPKAGLLLDSRDALLRGGESGPALVPGDPERSLLIRAIGYHDPDLQMPPKTRLETGVVEHFRQWILQGAAWPASPTSESPPAPARAGSNAASGTASGFDLAKRRAAHWAWQPIRRPAVPAVRNTRWPRDDLDRFVLAKLEAADLEPARPADFRTLARRAAFALIGLPPTPAELAEIDRDPTPEGFARQVDRWLASPHFGERWSRHWLDKVRYAETFGHEFDYPILGAWRYRDYVTRAFNTDLSYREFVREQIAGDLLPGRKDPDTGANESLLATLQWWLPQQVHSPVDARAYTSEVIDNQIDVFSKAFLGLTVACARCHDHKFDAVSTRDYYALHGILDSSRYAIRDIRSPESTDRRIHRLAIERRNLRRALADRLLAEAPNPTSTPPPLPTNAVAGFRLGPDDLRLSDEGWLPTGPAFAAERTSVGEPIWLGAGDLRLVAPGWRHGASLSRRLQGALRTPTFVIDRDFLHLRLAGRGTRFGVAIEGFTLIRAPIYGTLRQGVQRPEPHWVTLDVSMWKGRRAWIEFADYAAPDPASDLPPETRSTDGWIAVADIVRSPRREPPAAEPPVAPADFRAVVERWREDPDRLTADEIAALEAALRALPLPESAFAGWKTIEDDLPEPILVGGIVDGTGLDDPVFVRGNYRLPGPVVPRRFLEALPATDFDGAAFAAGSGRLALAEATVHPDNPFPARVHANWVWAHLFGRGLVASVDNFGVLGERPTHPELLDWLAEDLRRHGWSTKQLIRRILLSRTWQMSSRATDAGPEAERRDPDNLLLHRANLRRLEGEIIRDTLLAVSGRLDPRVGGPPVAVHLTPFMDGRGRPGASGPLDGDGRRSLYLEVRRNFLSPFFLAFDSPVPFTTVGRRSVSNVPAQALALMNDPFVVDQARTWAARLAREAGSDPTAQVDLAYALAFGRSPRPEEQAEARDFLAPAGTDGSGGLVDFCHALFNAKEFVYVE